MINKSLKIAFLERNVSQREVAKKIDIDPARISRIIRGKEKPTFEIKRDLSKYFNKPEKDLFL